LISFEDTSGERVNAPEYFAVLQESGEAPKVVVCPKIVRKRDSNFFAASIAPRIEATDFYLIRARKIAQLVGLDRSKQKPYLQRNHSSRDWEGKGRGAVHRQEE
jgi:hypothetical protein